jgi:hypothetical protein
LFFFFNCKNKQDKDASKPAKEKRRKKAGSDDDMDSE